MKNKLQPKILLLVYTLLFFVFQTKSFAGPSNFTWTGTTSTSWTTATNWTPNGVPSTSDTVTIVSGSRDVSLSGNITVKKFTITSGTVYLNDFTLTITTHATFTSGTITAGAGRLVVSSATSTTFSGTTFSVPTTITSNAVYLNGSTFNDSLTITKNGNSNDNSKGGNLYKKQFLLTNSAKGAFVLSDSFPDTYEKKLIIKNTNEGTVYLAHRASGTIFKDDVTFYGKNIYSNYYGTAEYQGNIILNCPAGNVYFGYGSGSSTLANTKRLQLGDSAFAAGKLTLMHFTKLGTDGEINLTLTGSAILTFESGTVINSTIAISSPTLYLHGARFNNLADLTVTGTSTASSEGGCYFAADAKITNNSSGTNSFALGNTVPDTFATTSTITNTKGTLSMNNAVFVGNTILKNVETSTNSDRFIIASTGNCVFQGNIQIQNSVSGFCFGKTSGTASLASGKTLSFVSGFTGNLTLKNFTQQGSTAQSFSFTSTGQKLFLGPGSTFNGNFDFTGHFIVLNGTTFNGTATINRYGGVPDTCAGGNIFNSTTIIKDSSNAAYSYLMAYSNADDYNGDVTFIQKGSGAILYPCYNKNSTFAGNITVNSNSAFQFGGNGGKVILDGTTNQNLSNLSSYPVTMKKLQLNKTANSFTLSFPLTVSDSLILTQGRINTDTINLLSISNGGKLNGGSDNSYVNGPMKKTGNSTFVFPLGSSSLTHPYHPLEISTPSSTTDAYTANYFSTSQTISSAIDTSIDNLNACQYWKLNRNTGTSKVKVKLSWNNDSCETISPIDMRVVGWDGSKWKDFHSSSYSGNKSIGTSTSVDSTNTISVFTLSYRRCAGLSGSIEKQNVSCFDATDGFAKVLVKGGTSPYKYVWSKGMGDQAKTPAILFPGQFVVTISDSLNCHISDTVTITQPAKMNVSFSTGQSACGDSTGSAIVSASGGVGLLKNYFWSETRETNDTLSNVPSGNYTVLVTDSNGCTLFGSVQISDSDGPTISLFTDSAITCYGDRGGYSEISVTGASPFTYIWSTSPSDTSTFISNVYSGIYSVKVIDSLGCISYQSIEIEQPDTFRIDLNVTDATCALNNDGLVIASVHGGVAPYSYLWYSSTGINNDSLLNRPSGIDTLLVTDANGCSLSSVFEISNSGGFSLSTTILTTETCFNDRTASAKVDISGGTAPFTYLWQPYGGNNDTATGLISNFYKVTVIDGNGCRKNDTLFITGPDNISIEIHKTLPTNEIENDGFAEAVVIGGVAPYTYNWNTGSASYNALNLGLDDDTLIVQDANGCVDSAYYRIIPQNIIIGACSYTNTPDDVSGCTYTPPPITPTIQMDILDFGADGTDFDSDECAFELAAQYFSSLDSAIIKILNISHGTYYIGKQDPGVGSLWLSGHNVLSFSNIRNLTIQGEVDHQNTPTTILKLNPCIKYGAFNPTTGQRHIGYVYIDGQSDPVLIAATVLSGNFNICATVGDMIYLNYCNRITIRNLELDGNISETVIGGGYTEGIQLGGYSGITMNSARNVIMDNVLIHHFGYDGLTVRDSYCPYSPYVDLNAVGLNLRMNKCNLAFNARNNVTWAGGYKLTATNCSFNYAGQSRFISRPGAGLDIEYEDFLGAYGYPNSNGTFYNCNFKYNFTYGLINDVHATALLPNYPPTRNMKFNNCTFIGDVFSIQNSGKQVVFDSCTFVGTVSSHYGDAISFANSRTRRDQTIFRNSRFLEFWFVPGVGVRSFQQTADDNIICPTGGHAYLLNVQGARTEFFNSYVVTNYSMRGAYMKTNPEGYNQEWWNKFQFNNMNFYSFGLNECSCENGAELSVFENVNLSITAGLSAHWVRSLYYRNPGPGCVGLAYNSQFATFFSTSIDLVDASQILPAPIFQTAQFIPQGFYPAYPKFVQPYLADRLELADLFSYDALNPSFDTYNGLTSICIDPPERRSFSQKEINESEGLKLFPTPSQDFVTLTGKEGSLITIKNLLGETIKLVNLENKNYTLQIDKMKCGLYLVSDDNGNVAKLIIAR